MWQPQQQPLGPIWALKRDDSTLFVCGEIDRPDASGGYLQQFRIFPTLGAGDPPRLEQEGIAILPKPCRGLAIDKDRIVWISKDLEVAGAERSGKWWSYIAQRKLVPLSEAKRLSLPERTPRRGFLDGDRLYVAAGDQGVLESRWKIDHFEPSPDSLVSGDARDVQKWKSWIFVADWNRGLVAFNPTTREVVQRWRDNSLPGPIMAQELHWAEGDPDFLSIARGGRGASHVRLQAEATKPRILFQSTQPAFGAPVFASLRLGADILSANALRMRRYRFDRSAWKEVGTKEIAVEPPLGDWWRAMVAIGPDSIAMAKGGRLMTLRMAPPRGNPEIRPLVNSGFAYIDGSNEVKAEFHFVNGRHAPLYLEKPRLESGLRLRLDTGLLQPSAPGCTDRFVVPPGALFSVLAHPKKGGKGQSRDYLFVESNDPSHRLLRLSIDINPLTAKAQIGTAPPPFRLPAALGGIWDSASARGRYLVVEYVGPGSLSTEEPYQKLQARIKEFRRMEAQQSSLHTAFVFSGAASFEDLGRMMALYTIADRPRLPLAIDPYFEAIRRFSRREGGGSLYPFRVLYDREGKIVAIDRKESLDGIRAALEDKMKQDAAGG